MYKALLTDLDDTLIASNLIYNKALMFAAKFLAEKYDIPVDEFYEVTKQKHSIVAQNFPTVHTRHSRIIVFRMALDHYGVKYDMSLLPDAEDMYWDYFLRSVKVYPNVISTLGELRSKGIKISIVSDGDLSLRIRKLKYTGLLDYVDEVVASEEVIFEKPFSAIFTLALSRIGVEHKDAIMLGNDLKHDIRGAQLLGIKAGIYAPTVAGNYIDNDSTVVPDFVINNFEDLILQFEL